MDLSFTKVQEEFRLKAREWLSENLPKDWVKVSKKNETIEFLRDWEKRLYEGGYAGISWPKEYGGQGLTIFEEIIFENEAGKLNAPQGLNKIGKLLLGPTLLKHGNEEQKKRFILPLLKGEEIWCQGFSEPNAGSDLAAIQTRAVCEDDQWVINGQKVWTSFAHQSDWCFVIARTDFEASKHKGISFFLVPMNDPGVTVRPLTQINKEEDFNEVFFEDVRIPNEYLVGEVNQGWQISMSTLGFERGILALGRQARFQLEFDHIIKVAKELRDQNGVPIINNPYYRQKFAALLAELEIFRYYGLKTASNILNNGNIGAEASLQKLFWSRMHQKIGELGMEVLGKHSPAWGKEGIGYGAIQGIFLKSRAETIYAGSSEIQKNIIAERLLGMPK